MLSIEPKYFIFKYLWLVILLPKTLQILLLLAGAVYFMIQKLEIDKRAKLFFVYIACQFIAIFINSFNVEDVDRLIAAIGNGIIFFVAIIYYLYYKQSNLDKSKVVKYSLINFIIMLLISVQYVVSEDNFVIFGNSLKRADFGAIDSGERMTAYVGYPNAITWFCILMVIYIVLSNYRKSVKIILIIFSIIPVYLSASRMGLLCILFIVGASIINLLLNKYKKVIWFFICGVVLATIGLFMDVIVDGLYDIFNSRASSSSARVLLYTRSIEMTLENNVFIGNGIKHYSSEVGVPMGSHSSVIGYFYKTGIIGLAIICIAFYSLFINLVKNGVVKLRGYYGIIAIGWLMFMLVEDLDGTSWVIVLFFTTVGVLLNNTINQERKNEN